jgi:hypothetical protein
VLPSNVQKLAGIGVLAAAMVFAAPIPQGLKPLTAYYESNSIQFLPEAAATPSVASLGPWVFGARLFENKPLDKRLNLYVVIPGKQYSSADDPEYDHNLVVNTLTQEKVREWDIFWCFILDPTLDSDLRNEHDLLVAAQQTFRPGDLFDMEDIPAHEALREKTGIESLAGLRRYRRPDGALPRILIVPAKQAVSARAEMPPAPADETANK